MLPLWSHALGEIGTALALTRRATGVYSCRGCETPAAQGGHQPGGTGNELGCGLGHHASGGLEASCRPRPRHRGRRRHRDRRRIRGDAHAQAGRHAQGRPARRPCRDRQPRPAPRRGSRIRTGVSPARLFEADRHASQRELRRPASGVDDSEQGRDRLDDQAQEGHHLPQRPRAHRRRRDLHLQANSRPCEQAGRGQRKHRHDRPERHAEGEQVRDDGEADPALV